MKRAMRKAILISAMLIVPVMTIWSQETEQTAEKFFNSMSDEHGDVSDYQAYLTITKGNNVQSGLLYYKTPNKLRINFDNPDEECDLDYVPNVARKMKVDYAMTNSFGFGGTNASLILKRLSSD